MQKKIYLLSAIILCSFFKLNAQLTLNIPDQTVACGQTITLPVTVEDFENMRGLSFSINWDVNQITFDGNGANEAMNLPGNPVFSDRDTADGKLSFLWFHGTPTTLNNGDTIMLFTLQVTGNNFTTSAVDFSNDPLVIEGNNGAEIPVAISGSMFTLMDDIDPIITCPQDQTGTAITGNNPVAIMDIAPDASDNCGIDSITYRMTGATIRTGVGNASGQLFNVGTTTVTYVAKDFAGNTEQCSFEVSIAPSEPVDTVEIDGGRLIAECGNTLNVPFSVTDFESVTSVQLTLNWDATKFTYSSINNLNLAGLSLNDFNTSQAAAGIITLNWLNVTPQTLANSISIFELELLSLGTVSNEPIEITNLSIDRNSISFPSKSTNANISIQDTSSPTISCPDNQEVVMQPGMTSFILNNITPIISDNCGTPSLSYEMTGATTGSGIGSASGESFNLGVTTITYTTEDAAGLSRSCSFTVTVSGDSPTNFTLIGQSETANCDADDIAIDINVAVFDSITGTQFSVNWDPSILSYVSTDNIQFPGTAGFDEIDVAQGRIGYAWFNAATETLTDGATLFTLHFKPNGGGTTDIIFTGDPTPIEINQRKDGRNQVLDMDSIFLTTGSVLVQDTTAPIITCPNDTLIMIASGETAIVHGIGPVISDNCGVPSIAYTLSGATVRNGGGTASGQVFNVGTTTLTYTITDGSGNVAECSSTVTVSVPNAIELNAITNIANCGDSLYKVDITVDSFMNAKGLQFSVGWDSNILKIDSVSNFGLADFTDNNFNIFENAGQLAFAWSNSAGNGQTLANGAVLFSIYFEVIGDAGAITTILIGDDPTPREGNISIGNANMPVPVIGNSSQLEIIDNIEPFVQNNFPDTIFQYVNADSCTVSATWVEPSFSDQCSANLTLTRSHTPGSIFEEGAHAIIYTATDGAGNRTVDSTILIVRDTIKPVFDTCPTDIMATPDANCRAIVTWTEPTAFDNCALIVVVSSTHNPGDTFTTSTTVTYTAEDVYGNIATCSFEIVMDNINPILINNFPGDITINAAQGQCGANIGWTIPTAVGGCTNDGAPIDLTSSHQPGDFFPVGTTDVIYTASDAGGQMVMDTFQITVIDNQDLVVICPTDIEIQADGMVLTDEANFINTVSSDSCGSYSITFNDITAFDNCSPINITQTAGPTSDSVFTFGASTLTFEIADTLGNTRTCSFQIIINETQQITVGTLDNPTCAGSDLRLFVDTLAGGTYQWTGPGGFLANVQNPIIPNVMTQNSGDYVVKVISPNGCTIKDSVSVRIFSGPIVEATANDITCTVGGDSLRLFANITNGIPDSAFMWTGPNNFSTNVQNPIIPNATEVNAGQYIVTALTRDGCSDTDTVNVSIEMIAAPVITEETNQDTICLGESVILIGTGYEGSVAYNWLAATAAGLPANVDTNRLMATPTAAGTYNYAFTANVNGSCQSDTAGYELVVIDAGMMTLSTNSPLICVPDNLTIDLMATGGVGVASYAWTGPNDFTSSEQNPSLPVANEATGIYTLMTTFNSGCTITDTISVVVSVQGVAPTITIAGGNTNICEGDALTLMTDAVDGATYSWIGPNNFISSEQNPVISNVTDINAGAYQLRITTADGCESAPATVGPINVLSDPTIENDVVFGPVNQIANFDAMANDQVIDGVPITVTVVSDAVNGTLTNNNDGTFSYRPNTDFVGMEQVAYEICYTDCPALCGMATVTIRVEYDTTDCIVPTFISPNGDGFNDELFISCISNPPKQGSELIIFNEWGSEVFRQAQYDNTWAGTYNGKDLPDGTYYYVYKQDSDDNNPKKGYFTILR